MTDHDHTVPPPEPITAPERELGRLGNQLMVGLGPGPTRATRPPSGSFGRAESEPTDPLDEPIFAGVLRLAERERVTGLVAYAIAEGALAVTDAQLERAAASHREAMAIALVLEQMLCRVHGWLSDAGVDHVVLKGPAIAHTVYPDPSLRDFGDIDLLLPAEQLDGAIRLLLRQGVRRPLAELAPGWDRQFAKSITLTDPSGYQIDAHRTIAPGIFGLRIDVATLFTRTQPFTVGGHQLRALSPEDQLLQACLHTAAGNRRVWLSSVCDIAQLTRSGRVDLDAFHTLARDWGVAAAVERAMHIVGERLDGADVSVLVDGLHVTAADRRRLDRYGGGFSGAALTGFAALPLRQWARYARALLWPSAANLRDRDLTRAAHLRRLTTHLQGR